MTDMEKLKALFDGHELYFDRGGSRLTAKMYMGDIHIVHENTPHVKQLKEILFDYENWEIKAKEVVVTREKLAEAWDYCRVGTPITLSKNSSFFQDLCKQLGL